MVAGPVALYFDGSLAVHNAPIVAQLTINQHALIQAHHGVVATGIYAILHNNGPSLSLRLATIDGECTDAFFQHLLDIKLVP